MFCSPVSCEMRLIERKCEKREARRNIRAEITFDQDLLGLLKVQRLALNSRLRLGGAMVSTAAMKKLMPKGPSGTS